MKVIGLNRKKAKSAAEDLRSAFHWDGSGFPDLSNCSTDGQRWSEIYRFLLAASDQEIKKPA